MNPWISEDVELRCGDALAVLKTLPSESIDLVVTSPPYDDLRTYNGSCSWNFEGIVAELLRVVKSGGVVCWIVGDSVTNGSESLTSFNQAIAFKSAGFLIHDTMIYEKLNFSHPDRVRYHQLFEYIFILCKPPGPPRIFNPIIDKPNAAVGAVGSLGINTFTKKDGSKSVRSKKINAAFGKRGNVWRGKTRGQEEMCQPLPHPAMMPRWLARDLILSWSNREDLICDPFLGSGTVAEEAFKIGRRVVGIELNPDYCEMAKRRIQEAQTQPDLFVNTNIAKGETR